MACLMGLRHAFPLREVLNLNRRVPEWIKDYLPARGIIEYRHLPFLFLLCEVYLGVFVPGWFQDWPMGVLAFFSAWLYVRYCMHFPYANVRGDHSVEFSLSCLFPKLVRPHVEKTACIVYEFVVGKSGGRLELRSANGAWLYQASEAAAGPFDERKSKALQFLDENIAAIGGRKSESATALTREEIAEV